MPHIRLPTDGAAAQTGGSHPARHHHPAGGGLGGEGGLPGLPLLQGCLRYYRRDYLLTSLTLMKLNNISVKMNRQPTVGGDYLPWFQSF